MPVRIYGGFEEGIDPETGRYYMYSIIYRVGDEFKIATINATYDESEYGKDIWEREAKPRKDWKIEVQPYFHWVGAWKWGAWFFRKPIEVADVETAHRLLKEPLVIYDGDIFLAIDEGVDFEYRVVEYDEVDKPL